MMLTLVGPAVEVYDRISIVLDEVEIVDAFSLQSRLDLSIIHDLELLNSVRHRSGFIQVLQYEGGRHAGHGQQSKILWQFVSSSSDEYNPNIMKELKQHSFITLMRLIICTDGSLKINTSYWVYDEGAVLGWPPAWSQVL